MIALRHTSAVAHGLTRRASSRLKAPSRNTSFRCLVFGLLLLSAVLRQICAADGRWWSDAVANRLDEALTNRAEILQALDQVPLNQREGMVFLLENMPTSDVKSLSAAFLLNEVTLAFQAWERSPWHEQVSSELFLNDVLPYACLNEARDPWRATLRELCQPMVASCTQPGEAAHVLNQKLFPAVKVRYNTGRRRPDQSPRETMESGVATCTGLSILLVDACRSVGIPARIAGTPMWSNQRGNHTWVEVWDGGWHFAGAAEPDGAGLDHGWFVHDASEAQRDVPRHAIYASSFRRTGISFPLVWRPGDQSVSGVNVTDRYTANAAAGSAGTVRLSVKVIEPRGKRAIADLTVSDPLHPATTLKDTSRGETADLNDLAAFQVVPGRKYHVVARVGSQAAESDVTVTDAAQQVITLSLAEPSPGLSTAVGHAATAQIKPLPAKDAARVKQGLTDYFSADPARQAQWRFPSRLERLLKQNEPAVRPLAWEAYASAPIHAQLKADFDAHLVNFESYQSPWTVKAVGERPAKGWALFIAMHGGGNAPKAVNDSQWKHMQIYYKDHPEAGGYLYVALRAPNDTWNGFYADYVYPLIDNLLRQFRLFGDIDPDKVFIMGYSHGGYGAYAIGPKMPDRFAAIHASAAAGTDGETTGHTLRTTPFTAMVGERDTMYGRYERNLRFKEQIEQLRNGRTNIYPVTVTVVAGNGHTGLPDRDIIADMYPAVRNPVPRELDWFMTDGVVQDFFWLRVRQPSKEQQIIASCQSNHIVITATTDLTGASVLLDARLIDFSKPVKIEVNGSSTLHRFTPSLKTLCQTLARRADPGYAFSAEFEVVKDSKTARLAVAFTSPR